MNVSEILKNPTLLISVILNLIPIYGVFVWDWSINDIFILFLWEAGLVGVISLLGLYILLLKNKSKSKELRKKARGTNWYFITFVSIALIFWFIEWQSEIDFIISESMVYIACLFLIKVIFDFTRFQFSHDEPLKKAEAIRKYMMPNMITMIIFLLLALNIFTRLEGAIDDFGLYFALFLLVISQTYTDLIFSKDRSKFSKY